ncbi:MAG: DUF3037 domain-containing protein, partial [Dehalococcoidia bacterium]
MKNLTFFSYSLLRFVPDVARDEAINLGVIVVSDDERLSDGAFLSRFRGRLRSLAPTSNADAVENAIAVLRLQLGAAYQPGLNELVETEEVPVICSTPQLAAMAATMRNQFQLTEPRRYRAASLKDATSELFRDLVSPLHRLPSTSKGMTLHQLQVLIRRTIRDWGGTAVRIQERGLERARGARHFADFWVESGNPIAALIAIPEDPGERDQAWARRDSVPTIAAEFRTLDPRFQAVAVFPPNGHEPTEFVRETTEFLARRDGVLVIHADQLD